ncbi:hypothetical protein EGW08_012856 [Elysia chlorotica]|uniref:Uncharacterized protein n=1 Tax=Elysia chlorotica TaxID=188477 RepID=A0A3S1HHE1_ELYCH|nr:hypothetical protein EGW08_012856 [Elysia chlorotica]
MDRQRPCEEFPSDEMAAWKNDARSRPRLDTDYNICIDSGLNPIPTQVCTRYRLYHPGMYPKPTLTWSPVPDTDSNTQACTRYRLRSVPNTDSIIQACTLYRLQHPGMYPIPTIASRPVPDTDYSIQACTRYRRHVPDTDSNIWVGPGRPTAGFPRQRGQREQDKCVEQLMKYSCSPGQLNHTRFHPCVSSLSSALAASATCLLLMACLYF